MKTKIPWCDHVWNYVTGCEPTSPGCDTCYAQSMAKRLHGRAGYPDTNPFAVTVHEDHLDRPLHIQAPSRIFVNSMGDWGHRDVPVEAIDRCLEVMDKTQQHTYIILTKRPATLYQKLYGGPHRFFATGQYLQNLWIGVSVESQAYMVRVRELQRIPAALHIVCFEPLIGAIAMTTSPGIGLGLRDCLADVHRPNGIRWVIVGCETGPRPRPMGADWVRRIRDACLDHNVPFYLKQRRGWGIREIDREGLLEGVQWRQMPA